MGRRELQVLEAKIYGFCSGSGLGIQWSLLEGSLHPGGLFASVSQMGNMGFGISPNPPNSQDNNNGGFMLPYTDVVDVVPTRGMEEYCSN